MTPKSRPDQMADFTLSDRVYHCGLDDTIDVLEEINHQAGRLQSIFEVDVMRLLQQWHDRYGTKFSLYLFYEKLGGFNLSQMTDKFAAEWQAHSDWLKLSFHARTKKPGVVDYYLYNQADYATARDDFHLIKREILRFAGPACWDNYPRTHFWSGSKEAVRAWRDCGADGLFYSYPGYSALYFDQADLHQLWHKDYWYDHDLEMLYITTNVKLPCLTLSQVKTDLARLQDRPIVEIFADDYNIIELQDSMETAIAWAVAHGFKPVFYNEVFDSLSRSEGPNE